MKILQFFQESFTNIVDIGGAGTTLTAFEVGVPQIIVPIPETCADQILHSGTVATMRCGIHLRSRTDMSGSDEHVKDVVDAVQEIRLSLADFKTRCDGMEPVLRNAKSSDATSSCACEIIRKVILRILPLKLAGQWNGWEDQRKSGDPDPGSVARIALDRYEEDMAAQRASTS